MKDKLDIIMVFETKLFDSFSQGKFQIKDYSKYRKDTNDKGGGMILFIREDTILIECRKWKLVNTLLG